MPSPLDDQRVIREIISQELSRRIDIVIEQRLRTGLLDELTRAIHERHEEKFKRLEALNTIVEQLRVLFANANTK